MQHNLATCSTPEYQTSQLSKKLSEFLFEKSNLNNWEFLKFKLHLSRFFGRMDKWNEIMAGTKKQRKKINLMELSKATKVNILSSAPSTFRFRFVVSFYRFQVKTLHLRKRQSREERAKFLTKIIKTIHEEKVKNSLCIF